MVVYDSIVVGLGGAGSSAAYHLSRAGLHVLGLEQFGPTHSRGSSHGRTRIYRTAYSEGTAYVPLVQRAQELWAELGKASNERILRKTGGLLIGRREGPTVAGAIRSATAFSLDHRILTSAEVREEFPRFRPRQGEVGFWDPDAGVLFPENCIVSHVSGAVAAGAELHYGEAVRTWSASSDAAEVQTVSGTYHARTLVLTAGPWTAAVAESLQLPLQIERQVVFWFPPASAQDPVGPDRMPVFIWETGTDRGFYGIPDFGDGVKVASQTGRIVPVPDAAGTALTEADAVPVREFVRERLSGVTPREGAHASCLYTNAPDHNFLIGTYPGHPNVILVSACSGHGFKFTSVVGEIVRRLVQKENPGFDLTLFAPGRFSRTARA